VPNSRHRRSGKQRNQAYKGSAGTVDERSRSRLPTEALTKGAAASAGPRAPLPALPVPLFLLPAIAREMTVTTLTFTCEQSGAVSSFGLRGRTADASALLIAYEAEIEDWGISALPRSAIDLTVFARFAEHIERSRGQPEFTGAVAGADPPDLQVTCSEGRLGLELTQFADPERREAATRLALVKRKLDASLANRPDLAGWRVFIWTEDLSTPDFLRSGADEIVEALGALRPLEHLIELQPGDPLPNPLPRLPEVVTPSGMRLLAGPPGGFPMTTRFASRHGFDLGLAHTTLTTWPQAYRHLTSAIADKDREGNDALLVTFGGFDQTGMRWPAESLVYGLLTSEVMPPIPVRHLRHVYLNDWTGPADEVPLTQTPA